MAAPGTAAEYVVMRRPSLSSDQRVADFIAHIEAHELDTASFGSHGFVAVGLLCLHMIEVSESATNKAGGNRHGTGGAIISETEGRLSRSYDHGALVGYAAHWNSTSWGQELTALCARMGFGAMTRMM